MRELKGDWKDIFRCFMLALDLRKMFLAFCGVVLTIVLVGGTQIYVAHKLCPQATLKTPTLAPHYLLKTWGNACHTIYTGCNSPNHPYTPVWYTYTPVSIIVVIFFLYIWAYFGGAIARIAAYEIAKDERIETAKALSFSGIKLSAFVWAPLICVIGLLFFFLCNAVGGLVGKALDYIYIGAPLISIFLPLALLSGFIMMLIVIGSVVGSFLFQPAIGAEGTDAFDAVSRGFSYIYAKPWHYLWYQLVAGIYGKICIMFVLLFAFLMCVGTLKSGAYFYPEFKEVNKTVWSQILDPEHSKATYKWDARSIIKESHCYGRFMSAATELTKVHYKGTKSFSELRLDHKIAGYIILAYLLITMGIAASYIISYFQSAQTLIYFLMRKKVDGIDMDEVYEEPEEEEATKEATSPPVDVKKEETK